MKHKIIMLYIFIPIALVVIMLIIGKINLSVKFGREVQKLFAESKSIADQLFHKAQLDNLPEPVQRYFKHVLKERQP